MNNYDKEIYLQNKLKNYQYYRFFLKMDLTFEEYLKLPIWISQLYIKNLKELKEQEDKIKEESIASLM